MSKTVIDPRINLSNRFSALSFDENDKRDRDAVESKDTKQRVTKCTQATSNQLSQTSQREQNRTKRKNKTQRHPEAPTTEHQCQQTKQQTVDRIRNHPHLVVVGDSVIKRIERAKFRQGLIKSRLTSRTFSGVKTDDMKHYLQPTLKAKPPHLIINVGTNDLYGKSF